MNDKREPIYVLASILSLMLAIVAAASSTWQAFAPSIIGAVGWAIAYAEVKGT